MNAATHARLSRQVGADEHGGDWWAVARAHGVGRRRTIGGPYASAAAAQEDFDLAISRYLRTPEGSGSDWVLWFAFAVLRRDLE